MIQAAYPIQGFWDTARSRRLRSWRQFAEEEIVIASGPKRGLKFSCGFMPFMGLVLDVFDRSPYQRFFLSGPAQAGKTLGGLIIPCAYTLFELEEDFIIGAPTADLAHAIWRDRIRPSILLTRYRNLLPRAGAGSRGGKTLDLTFRNGRMLRFMGAGGSDAQRSSYTALAVGITEVDKMDTPSAGSRESDPVTQIEERTASFSHRGRTYAECTMSTKEGRTYREIVELGTDTKPYFRCPFCRQFVPLERASFFGWQETPDELTARERAWYRCPTCQKDWNEDDRRRALLEPVLVSRDQKVNEQGEVLGDAPRTGTWGFRWNALASPLRSMADIAQREWRADRATKDEDRKALHQFVWAEPYAVELPDFRNVNEKGVLSKIVQHPRGAIPEGTVKLTLFIDVGSHVCWWALMAWRDAAQGHVVDFGSIDIPDAPSGEKNPHMVLASLRAFRDQFITPGWGGRQPDLVLVDSGWEHETVYTFVAESGQGHYLASKGFGMTSRWGAWGFSGTGGKSKVREVGNEWVVTLQAGGIALVEMHADYWKGLVHDGFGAARGAPGSITVFHGRPEDKHMRIFARQITAERREVDPNPNKETKIKWVVLSKANHYLDCCVGARVAADMLGIKLATPATVPEEGPPATPPPPSSGRGGWLRSKY